MQVRTVAMSGVVAAMLVFAGACASEPSEDRPSSAGPSVEESESSPTETKPSVDEPTDDPSKKTDPPSEPTTKKVKVIDTDFRPVKVMVPVGATVNWKQVGDQPHSVTAADGSFDSSPECGPLESDKCLGEGDRFTHTFDQAGEFTYYCRVHGLPDGTGMVGTIVVR